MNPLALETLAVLLVVPALYWTMPRQLSLGFVALMSAAVLAVLSPKSLAALAVLTWLTYRFAHSRLSGGTKAFAGVGAILSLLVGYKVWVAEQTGGALPRTALLLGFSYYTLRAIHYLVEHFRGALPAHSLRDFAQYMFFLPVLPAGPIHRFGDFMREARRRRWDAGRFSRGLERILFGYSKIVLLANYLTSQKLGTALGGLGSARPSLAAYLECVQYGADLYFRFAGLSDIAIGFSLLLGIRIVENFNHPFASRNIVEFWNHWHISLTSFCRDYVYMPVAAASRRPALAVAASMLVVGMWHELSPRYLAWGTYHGAGILVWHGYRRLATATGLVNLALPQGLARALGIALTLNFVILSFAITKEATLTGALDVYVRLWEGRF